MNTYKIQFEGHARNLAGELIDTVEDTLVIEARSADIEDVQHAVEKSYGQEFGSFYLNTIEIVATATRIRKTQNESINYGDCEVRKAVKIGKYNFLALVFVNGQDVPYIGASASADNANKWLPGPMSRDVYPAKKSDSEESKARVRKYYQDCKAKYGAPKKLTQRGLTFYRFTVPYTRSVVRINRS